MCGRFSPKRFTATDLRTTSTQVLPECPYDHPRPRPRPSFSRGPSIPTGGRRVHCLAMTPRAVIFDAGHTLLELDYVALTSYVRSRGHQLDDAAVRMAEQRARM